MEFSSLTETSTVYIYIYWVLCLKITSEGTPCENELVCGLTLSDVPFIISSAPIKSEIYGTFISQYKGWEMLFRVPKPKVSTNYYLHFKQEKLRNFKWVTFITKLNFRLRPRPLDAEGNWKAPFLKCFPSTQTFSNSSSLPKIFFAKLHFVTDQCGR